MRLSWAVLNFFGDFSLKLFLKCSYFLIFPNSRLVTRNNKGAKKYVFASCFIHRYTKNLTVSANVTSLLIFFFSQQILTILCIHLQYHLNLCTRIINFLNLSDQSFSLVIVLSLFLILEQILIKSVLIKI